MPIGSTNVDFKEIYDAINGDGAHDLSGNPAIGMDYFYGKSFTDGTSTPESGTIGIGGVGGANDMRSKTIESPDSLYDFTSHTFTNHNVTGQNGPTLSTFTGGSPPFYPSWASNLSFFNVTQGIQEWKVPVSGTYKIIAKGANGGHGGVVSRLGGLGAVIEGTFTLIGGDIIKILVGQKGSQYGDATGGATTTSSGGGGGGGTFVMKSPYSVSSVLIIAGGGGGSNYQGNNGTNVENINARLPNDSGTGGGIKGNNWEAGGGGGLISDGGGSTYGSSGKSLVNGGQGGFGGYSSDNATYRNHGGFGGGGGNGAYTGGGGGGINGGDTRHYSGTKGAEGGASYNTGTSQSSEATNGTHGNVTITLISLT